MGGGWQETCEPRDEIWSPIVDLTEERSGQVDRACARGKAFHTMQL